MDTGSQHDTTAAETTAASRGEAQGLPVAGYKPTQPAWAIDAVNTFKELEERTLRHAESLAQDPNEPGVDQRLLAVGKTQLQGAFMFLARAVFQPQRIRLPEDDELFSGKGDQVLHETDAKGG